MCFVRRVQIQFEWVQPLIARVRDTLLRRERAAPVPETMSRLRSRKKEIGEKIERGRSAARFEASGTEPPAAQIEPTAASTSKLPQRPQPTAEQPEQPPQESYTERLLKAKKKVWDDRDENKK